MGLAELVPGISGGTIAFVTGYAELVGALALWASLNRAAGSTLNIFMYNLGFLLGLGVGMVWASLCWRQGCDFYWPMQRHCCGRSFRFDMGLANLHWSRS